MAIAAKPVVLTRVASLPAGSPAPKPLVIVGSIPGAAITFVETALPATPGTFADLAAARTAVEALRAALAGSPYFS